MDLSPAELLEKALNGELSLDGDDDAVQTPATAATDEAHVAAAAKPVDGDDEHAGAHIASKSGAYTIPYEKLEQARDRVKSLDAENESLRAQIAELSKRQQVNLSHAEEQAQARADAGRAQTEADQNLETAKQAMAEGASVALFGDFSEEAIAKGISSLMAIEREKLREELRAERDIDLAPIKAQKAQELANQHYAPIYQKHADADEIVQSKEFDTWVKSLPSYIRNSVLTVLDPQKGGTSSEVIEVFDSFKAQTSAPTKQQPQGKAKALEVPRRIPYSLSEAAGEQPHDSIKQAMDVAGSNPNALLEQMSSMSPAQIERLMNAI